MTTTKIYFDPQGNQLPARPQQTANGLPIPQDSDLLLLKYGYTVKEVEVTPTEEELRQQRIAELKGYIALGYAHYVTQYIREQYDLDAELAIQRQRDTKAEDFTTYFTYCEDCKTKAQENIAAWEKELQELEPQAE